MQGFLLTRIGHGAVVLLVVSAVTFAIINLAPGGPSVLIDPALTPEQVELLRARLGLDEPIPVRYVRWLGTTLSGDLGSSLRNHRPVAEMIVERVPATLLLSGTALLISLGLGIPLGVLAAWRRNSWIDHLATLLSSIGVSIPVFWFGLMLILLFAVQLNVLPASGMTTPGDGSLADVASHLLLPAIVLGTFSLAEVTRYTRASVLSVLAEDYVRTARGKGASERRILWMHAVRNALVPIVTVVGLLLPRLVGGAPLTETVFSWPGLGRLAVDGAFQRDYPLVMAVTLVMSVAVVGMNLVVDLVYPVVDPRIRVR